MSFANINCLCIVLALLSVKASLTVAIQKPTNIEARRILLYNSSTSMADQQFNTTFLMSFVSLPLFVYGINEYKLGDQFYYQNFQSFKSAITQTSFSINVTSISSTNVKTFSISYFAAQPQSSFLSDQRSITNGINISTVPTSSYRYYEQQIPFSFNANTAYAFPLLTGYYISSSTYFTINITASVLSTLKYKFKVETGSDCAIIRTTFYLLFCQTTLLDTNNYYYLGGLNMVQSYNNPSVSSFTYAVNSYGITVFLLGLRGFAGYTNLSGCYWGWQPPSNASSATGNDTVTLTIYENQLQYIYMSFFQIGKYVNVTSNTTNSTTNATTNSTTNSTTNTTNTTTDSTTKPTGPETSSSSDKNYLPIIIGLLLGITLTTILIITFLKVYWKKAILNVPTHEQINQLPTISL